MPASARSLAHRAIVAAALACPAARASPSRTRDAQEAPAAAARQEAAPLQQSPQSGAGFRTVGRGACRTASGGGGTFTLADPATTAVDCESACAKDSSCVAYEVTYETSRSLYSPGDVTTCEIHTEPIMKTEEAGGVECWVREGTSPGQREYSLLGTGYCLPSGLDRFNVAAWDFAPPGSFSNHYECRTACNAEDSCTAYELRKDADDKLGCTLHTDLVTQVEPCDAGRSCWCWTVGRPPAEAGSRRSLQVEYGRGSV